MATKTISLEIDAYEKLRSAKLDERESFSSVVRRARWEDAPRKASETLANLENLVRKNPGVLLPARILNAMRRRKPTVRAKSRWES